MNQPASHAPAVTAKPIKLISGNSPFCETFFDDATAPKEHAPGVSAIVGEVNRGWDVAKYLLTHERTGIANVGASKAGLDNLVQSWAEELTDTPLRANLLNPGATRTRMRAKAAPGEFVSGGLHCRSLFLEVLVWFFAVLSAS